MCWVQIKWSSDICRLRESKVITTWSRSDADYNMDEAILVSLVDVIARHPWWEARKRIALELLKRNGILPPARVLDAGCGWGSNLTALEEAGYQVVGLDISHQALERLDSPNRTLIECDLTKPLPDNVESFDAVIALDVIEHLDDDAAAISVLGRLTRPGGLVIVSVPALPELMSDFDRVQGHRRRYIPKMLREAFVGSDLTVDRLFWWGSWMVPIIRRQRSQKKILPTEKPFETYRRYLSLPPWPVSLIFRLAFRLDQEKSIQGKTHTGTSLFAIARR